MYATLNRAYIWLSSEYTRVRLVQKVENKWVAELIGANGMIIVVYEDDFTMDGCPVLYEESSR